MAQNENNMAYRIRVDEGGMEVFAPQDTDMFVRNAMPDQSEQQQMMQQQQQMMQQQMAQMQQKMARGELTPQEQQQYMQMQQMQQQSVGQKRFSDGQKVFARLSTGWAEGKVVANDNPQTAYKIRMGDGNEVYAPMDRDLFVRTSLPTTAEEEAMKGEIMQLQQQQMQQQRMQQQQQQMQTKASGSLLDRG